MRLCSVFSNYYHVFNKLHIISETCSDFRPSQVLGTGECALVLAGSGKLTQVVFSSVTPEEEAGLKTTGEC